MKREDIILASASPRRIEMFHREGIDPRVIPADIDESLPLVMGPETAVMFLALSKALHVAEMLPADGGPEGGRQLIIAADTVVVYEGRIIGKPADEADAFVTLARLRGKTHQVITGVCLLLRGESGDSQQMGAEKYNRMSDRVGGPGQTGGNQREEATVQSGGPGQTEGNKGMRPADGSMNGLTRSSYGLKRCLYDVTDVTFGTYRNEDLLAYVRTPEPYDKAGGYAIQGTFGQYIDHIEGDLDNVIGFPMYRVRNFLQMRG